MRLLGSVLVLGATLWFGAYFAAKEKYRLQELAELERAILQRFWKASAGRRRA